MSQLFSLAVVTDGWKEVLDDVVLPVADLAVALDFLLSVVAVVDVEAGVVLEITESDLVEALHQHNVAMVAFTYCT